MKMVFKQKLGIFGLVFGMITLVGRAWADPVPMSLLNQPTRPTVQQVVDLLNRGDWKPDLLNDGSHLAKDYRRPALHLQNNFATWYSVLMEGAPHMIATFERSFPGATWAFIGRDMAILADLFEAFYLSLGQNDRVVRIGMSRNTLETITPKMALQFIKKIAKDPNYPLILVDTVSRGGGRQGRYLINAVYQDSRSHRLDASNLLSYFNFIGLLVDTSDVKGFELEDAYSRLKEEKLKYQMNHSIDFYNDHQVLTYHDHRSVKYLGINEAGYTHWVGAWHGPFGSMNLLPSGDLLPPQPGELEPQNVRDAVVQFQAHVIHSAMNLRFLKSVRAEAKKLGYQFPDRRPLFAEDPLENLKEDLSSASSLKELDQSCERFDRENFGRVSLGLMMSHLDKILPGLIEKFELEDLETIASSVMHRSRIESNCFGSILSDLTVQERFYVRLVEKSDRHEDVYNLIPQAFRKSVLKNQLQASTSLDQWLSELNLQCKKQCTSDVVGKVELVHFFLMNPGVSEVNQLLKLADKKLEKIVLKMAKKWMSKHDWTHLEMNQSKGLFFRPFKRVTHLFRKGKAHHVE